jgi:hypothetical protein
MKLRSIAVAGAMAIAGITAGIAAPAAQADAAAAADFTCVTVYDFPDMGLKYCYSLTGPCVVTEHRITFTGGYSRCLVPRPV